MPDRHITWAGPLTDPSGVAAQGRAFVDGLVRAGADVSIQHRVWHWREVVTTGERERLADLMGHPPGGRLDVHIQHGHARLFDPYVRARLRVGRTRWDFARVAPDAVIRARQMDDLWVPSAHVAEALIAEGMEPDRLWVVPEPIDRSRFRREGVAPLPLADAHGTVFLASLEWTARSGWDVLIDAWLRAFTDSDDATLVLKTWSLSGASEDAIHADIAGLVRRLGHRLDRMADVVLLNALLDTRRMPALYAAADVVVVPARATGFSRTAAEAMASGRPVIATLAGALGEMFDTASGWAVGHHTVGIPPAEMERLGLPEGAAWAEPDRDGLAEALRAAHRAPSERTARGAAAHERAAAYDHLAIARAALARIDEASPRPTPAGPRAGEADLPRVLLAGSIFGTHSLAAVNRELARELVRQRRVTLGLLDTEAATLGTTDLALSALTPLVNEVVPDVQVTVRHGFPPRFDAGTPGRVVQFLHWEYGPIPELWLRELGGVDEVWVASTWVARGMIDSGVDPDRVRVVPLGVDPMRFRPGVSPLDLGDGAPGFRFLFVGGLLWRKGIDLLLDAYELAFTRRDDVTLLVKDFGATGPYVPQEFAARIDRMRRDPGSPRIVPISGVLSEAEVPRLYAAASCLVHPYRGEGYALPIAEAMACGLPVVVPDLGACRDYAVPGTAVFVRAQHARLPGTEVGGYRLASAPSLVEVGVDELATAMRGVYEDAATHRALGARAAEHMHAHHTWADTARIAADRMCALAAGGAAPQTPITSRRPRQVA